MTVEKLMALDIEFCEVTSKFGASGWARHFKEDGIMLMKNEANIVGESEVYQYMKPFFDAKGNTLTWAPESGGISELGDLGYTYGQYIRKVVTDSGPKVETGRYMTIWRAVAPNLYKVEVDMGN